MSLHAVRVVLQMLYCSKQCTTAAELYSWCNPPLCCVRCGPGNTDACTTPTLLLQVTAPVKAVCLLAEYLAAQQEAAAGGGEAGYSDDADDDDVSHTSFDEADLNALKAAGLNVEVGGCVCVEGVGPYVCGGGGGCCM
jgi:hypothetical protein